MVLYIHVMLNVVIFFINGDTLKQQEAVLSGGKILRKVPTYPFRLVEMALYTF